MVFWTPVEKPMFRKALLNITSRTAITHSMLVLPVSFTHELVQTDGLFQLTCMSHLIQAEHDQT